MWWGERLKREGGRRERGGKKKKKRKFFLLPSPASAVLLLFLFSQFSRPPSPPRSPTFHLETSLLCFSSSVCNQRFLCFPPHFQKKKERKSCSFFFSLSVFFSTLSHLCRPAGGATAAKSIDASSSSSSSSISPIRTALSVPAQQ